MEREPDRSPIASASSSPHEPRPARPDDSQTLQSLFKTATDKTLDFLSTASNETLCACAGVLGVTTYFVLGRVGLVLIGVVGGVALHATWESRIEQGVAVDAASRKREAGVDVLRRVLDWRDQRAQHGLSSPIKEEEEFIRTSDFSSFQPDTSKALNELTDAIVQNYVKYWYTPIQPSDAAFPSACQQILSGFISSLSSNLSKKRPADTFLEFITNSSSVVIVVFNELTSALTASPGSTPENAIQTYLRLTPQSNLASILDQKHQQRKLKMVSDDILENYLDTSVYRCSPTRIFLREMFANVVLEMSLQQCSRAEFINDWIVYLLEEGEPEIMKEIDAGVDKVNEVKGLGIKKQVSISDAPTGVREQQTGERKTGRDHQRRVSRAEEAMDEAMQEAQRLTQMILDEEQRKSKELQTRPSEPGVPPSATVTTAPTDTLQPSQQSQATSQTNLSEASDSAHPGNAIHTPSSSQGDLLAESNVQALLGTTSDGTPDLSTSPPDVSSPSQLTQLPESVPDRLASTGANAMTPVQEEPAALKSTLSLVNAKLNIFDDLFGGDKRPLKTKPTEEYLIQIEPANSDFSGWMVSRTYSDFEVLHEVMRRIAAISGSGFTQNHATLPTWKGINKAYLKDELERYLADAVRYEPLAESEGMKRFLDRERGLQKGPPRNGAFWPNPANVGKGMLDVLSRAPGEVAGGSKAFFGGVTKAFTGGAAAKPNPPSAARTMSVSQAELRSGSQSSLHNASPPINSENFRRTPTAMNGSPRHSSDARSPSWTHLPDAARASMASRSSNTSESALQNVNMKLLAEQPRRRSETPEMSLPPPPDLMPDDYAAAPKKANKLVIPEHTQHASVDGTSFFDLPSTSTPGASPKPVVSPAKPAASPVEPSVPRVPRRSPVRGPKRERPAPKPKQPLTEQEAQVTVELLFAVINELYTLSSAWNIRRTLLTAAKTFLLRPGNPQLESIRVLLQESVLDANTSDTGIAALLAKLRENVLPTDAERARWPAPRSELQREELRKKARKLLIERGMPQALTSVMGAAASGEAIGRVFDCLQVEEVARGVMFGLLLQAVRAVTQ